MIPGQDPERARNRFLVIQAIRIGGVIMVLIGLLISAGKITVVPEIAGYVLIGIGLFDAFFVPAFLARQWSSRR